MAGGMDLGPGGKGRQESPGRRHQPGALHRPDGGDHQLLDHDRSVDADRPAPGRSAGGDSDPTRTRTTSCRHCPALTEKELKLSVGSEQLRRHHQRPRRQGPADAKLQELFKKIRDQLPDQNAITVQTEDAVKYEDLVRVIDEMHRDGLTAVSVSPVAS